MNNLAQLYPCLDSIKAHTTISYETLVVAYLFSAENKRRLRADYPWVKIIESDEIRGFAENNNLALRQAKGRYCFVVNDDTLLREPVLDRLVADFDSLPDSAAIVSPRLVGLEGETQVCGRPPKGWWEQIKEMLHLWRESSPSEYVDGEGVFRSYNIIGAAFLIRRDIFEQMGWFDEFYFFCPEDIALSTKLNECGYGCYVDADVSIVHLEGMSGRSLSMVQTATSPAGYVGSLHFFANKSWVKYYLMAIFIFLLFSVKFMCHRIMGLLKARPNYTYIQSICEYNVVMSIFSRKTPKEIFTRYYNAL